MIQALLALIRKEFQQALRDKQLLSMILLAPLIQIVLFGYAAQLEFKRADTVVVDQDGSEASRAFVEGLGADRTFRLRPVLDVAAATTALRDGQAAVAVILPRGFGRDRAAGRAAAVQVLYDGSDPTRGVAASAAIEAYAASCQSPERRSVCAANTAASASWQPGVIVTAPPGLAIGLIALEPRLLYNPGLDSQRFFVPGTGASLLVIITTMVTAMGLAREREVGTLEQLLVTPMGPLTLMVGKMIPYAIFGIIDEALILVVGNLVFDVPLKGDLLVLFVAAMGYLMCTLSLGLLIAASARSQQQAFMGAFFFMLPAILLSGFMTPIEAMPSWLQPLTVVNPMRHFVEVSRSILLRDAGFADVTHQLAMLWGTGGVLLVLAAVRFRRKIG